MAYHLAISPICPSAIAHNSDNNNGRADKYCLLREVFEQIMKTQDAILLDSAQHSGGQFDIVMFDSLLYLEQQRTNKHQELNFDALHKRSGHASGQIKTLLDALTDLADSIKTTMNKQSFFDVLSQIQSTVLKHPLVHVDTQTATLDFSLPFVVGMGGWFSYDLNAQFEAVAPSQTHYHTPLSRCHFFAQSLIYDKKQDQLYHCKIVELAQVNLLDDAINQYRSINSSLTRKASIGMTLLEEWQQENSQAQYINHIGAIHDYIVAGDCYQVNYAMRFANRYTGDCWETYKKLVALNQAPYCAYISTEHGAIMSLSPERFLTIKNKQVETQPIKGTMPRFDDPQRDKASAQALMESEKNQSENLMIVDLLRNDLSKHCQPHSVKVPALFELHSFPAVHHMISTVTGTLKADVHPWQLFAGAFPGGSITGAPKVRAMQVIRELEAFGRHIYCGSIAYVGHKLDMDSSICIRTLLAEQGDIYCWAGGGIVIDSNAQEEYDELHAKISKIIPYL